MSDALGVQTVKRRERRAPVTERDLQVASACDWRGCWTRSVRAGGREVKRRERRAPAAERDLQVASACDWCRPDSRPRGGKFGQRLPKMDISVTPERKAVA